MGAIGTISAVVACITLQHVDVGVVQLEEWLECPAVNPPNDAAVTQCNASYALMPDDRCCTPDCCDCSLFDFNIQVRREAFIAIHTTSTVSYVYAFFCCLWFIIVSTSPFQTTSVQGVQPYYV